MIALIMLVVGGLYLAIAFFAVRAAKTWKGKLAVALVFFFIPFGDALIGGRTSNIYAPKRVG